jgi:hypothetical protein
MLDASATTDPENDKLTYAWWILTEAGNYTKDVVMSGGDSNRATVQIPPDSAGKSFHMICEVTDNGTPPLSATQTFQVVVQEVATPELGATLGENDAIVLTWPTQPGVRYRVEYKDSLIESSWRVLSEMTGSGSAGSAIDSSLSTRTERYYRLVMP